MKNLTGTTIALALLMGCAATVRLPEPVEVSLFGIALNQPLNGLEECAWRSLSLDPKMRQYGQSDPQVEPCYQRSPERGLAGSPTPHDTEVVQVQFPRKFKPDLIRYDQVELQLLDGRVHTISVPTAGVSHQAQSFRILTAEFGPPTTQKQEPRKSTSGEWAQVIEASWLRPGDVRVLYAGAAGHDFNQGYVEVTTPQGAAYTRQRAEAARRNEPVR